MLAIRFNRTGKKNHASFRIVLQEHTKAPGKRHIEILGSYDPHKKTTVLKKERILYWIGHGAQTSPVVTNLLIREGVIARAKIAKKMPRPVPPETVAPETVTSVDGVASGIVSSVTEEAETPVTAIAEVSPAVETLPDTEKTV